MPYYIVWRSTRGATFCEKFCFGDLVTRYLEEKTFEGMQNNQKDKTSLWICMRASCELMCARGSTKCVHTFLRACVHARARSDKSCTSNRPSRPPDKLLFYSQRRFFKVFGHQLQKCKRVCSLSQVAVGLG